LSWFPNVRTFEANDKLKFVGLRTARFSLFQGVVADDMSDSSANRGAGFCPRRLASGLKSAPR
jgi:hypothetical protein